MDEDRETIEVTFTPSYNELLEAARDMHLRGSYYKRSLFYAFMFSVMGMMFLYNERRDLGMTFMFAALMYLASPYWHLPWRISRLRKRVATFREPMTIRLRAGEVSSETGGGVTTVTQLSAVRQSKSTLLLIINPETYIMVPKRAFESPACLARAEALAMNLAA